MFHIICWAKKLPASFLITLLSCEHKTVRFETWDWPSLKWALGIREDVICGREKLIILVHDKLVIQLSYFLYAVITLSKNTLLTLFFLCYDFHRGFRCGMQAIMCNCVVVMASCFAPILFWTFWANVLVWALYRDGPRWGPGRAPLGPIFYSYYIYFIFLVGPSLISLINLATSPK